MRHGGLSLGDGYGSAGRSAPAFAAIAHGSPQFTRDLDISYAGAPENLERLGRVLLGLGATLRGSPTMCRSCPTGAP
jgi:hypothetical protein